MEFIDDKIITIEVKVNAPLEEAWKIWTNPKDIINWNFASDDWHCPSATNDVSEGGKFSWRMEAKDGSFGFDFEGTYTKVIPNELLEYDLGDGRPVKVRFGQNGNQTLLTETFQGEDENTLEQQRYGWQCILNNYKACVEKE